ncbi:hypothetical protein [Sulfurovum sp.]|uniref:hypothetical protein n=1 Tax=Sulfurovum sp. TaxID=1969726 RepID=UPI003566EE24
MIAYNHYIKFIPKFTHHKEVKGSFSDVITIMKSATSDISDKFKYELAFFNNQERDISLYTDRALACTQKGQIWAFEVKNVVTFFWHSGTFVLEYIAYKDFTPELLEYWCLHIVLPIFFTVEETFDFFHAGAVEVMNKPVLFVAESFGGKSTMTDFFMKEGHTVISDDKVATYEKEGQLFAVPSHPHHRPYRKMEDLGVYIENFATQAKPIQAVYELEKAEADAKITITELSGIEKFITLRQASEFNLSFQKMKRFEFLMKVAKKVPVFKVKVPWDLDRMGEVHRSIVQHSRNLK